MQHHSGVILKQISLSFGVLDRLTRLFLGDERPGETQGSDPTIPLFLNDF